MKLILNYFLMTIVTFFGPQAFAEPSLTPALNTSETTAQEFRSIFKVAHKILYGKDLPRTDLDYLLYLAPDNMFKPAVNTPCAYCAVQNHLKSFTPTDLYREGQAADLPELNFNLNETIDIMESQDILVVILPGIFGEFIKTRAMEEIFLREGAFKGEWQSLNQKVLKNKTCYELSPELKNQYCDQQPVLKDIQNGVDTNENSWVPMEKLFHVASLEKNKKTYMKTALLHLEGASLESLGDVKDRASTFNRRLEKLFAIIGRVPKNIIFVGYSRGTEFGLEMLSQGKSEKKNWVANVKGMISLGGIVFGSALSDEGFHDSKAVSFRQLAAIKTFLRSLTKLPEMNPENYSKVSYNALITKYAALNVKAAKAFMETLGKLQKESLKAKDLLDKNKAPRGGIADVASLYGVAQKQMENFGFIHDNLADLKLSDIKALVALHNTHILRTKKFLKAVLTGVQQLGTDARMEWWRQANLPKHLVYYSLLATMDDPKNNLVFNDRAYNPYSPDDEFLRSNWQHYADIQLAPLYEGSVLNDSQVSFAKAHFWPEVIKELNPNLADLKTRNLAILGTHHWGLALPIVNPIKVLNGENNPDVKEKNPYPRDSLLLSLALTVSRDLKAREQNGSGNR
jgi:hypothetical protein